MTRAELYQKLEKAQELLCDVYQFACNNNLQVLENFMSAADTVITESYDEIECGETAELFKE